MSIPTLTAVALGENLRDVPDAPAHRPRRPLLLLGPSLGTAVTPLWAPAAAQLAGDVEPVGWELPGHGRGAADPEGHSLAELAEGVAALAARLQRERGLPEDTPFLYAGVSVGGAVGLELALARPERVSALAALCTGAKIGTEQAWLERAEFVAASGTPSQVIRSTQTWFADGFLAAQPVVATELMHSLQEADRHCYAQLCRALSRHDLRERLAEIRVPVLAVAGAEDPATPPACLREIAEGVPDGRLLVIEGAAHLACAEKPREVAEALSGFFAEHRPAVDAGAAVAAAGQADASRPDSGLPERSAARDRVHAEGTAVRRQVLSDAHVDRAARAATEFTAPFQDLISRYAWGEIWTRPGLDRPTRSAVTLTAMIAGQHWEEFDMHVRAARRNGVSVAQLQEILLQTAIYCSVPSANTAFARAQRVLREIGDLPPASSPDPTPPQDPDHADAHPDVQEDDRR
ncbi:alpha/beta fold hydrolase [Rothia kristinae]|uniref:bifunctional 3-oxoadipate enol-lactonase/4-carboxymuconolactone decarboxylase PcaDC n=1 Tax=Rothia kristinae TaxID=37923 RepID=UPI002FD7AFBD